MPADLPLHCTTRKFTMGLVPDREKVAVEIRELEIPDELVEDVIESYKQYVHARDSAKERYFDSLLPIVKRVERRTKTRPKMIL